MVCDGRSLCCSNDIFLVESYLPPFEPSPLEFIYFTVIVPVCVSVTRTILIEDNQSSFRTKYAFMQGKMIQIEFSSSSILSTSPSGSLFQSSQHSRQENTWTKATESKKIYCYFILFAKVEATSCDTENPGLLTLALFVLLSGKKFAGRSWMLFIFVETMSQFWVKDISLCGWCMAGVSNTTRLMVSRDVMCSHVKMVVSVVWDVHFIGSLWGPAVFLERLEFLLNKSALTSTPLICTNHFGSLAATTTKPPQP